MAQIAVAVALTVAVAAITSAMQPSVPPGLDVNITSSAYGESIPVTYGSTRLGTKLIWASNSKNVAKDKKGKASANGTASEGKKSKNKSGYLVSADLAFGICEGPIDNVLIIWANGVVIYDATGIYKNANGELVNAGNFRFTFYPGTETQMPDPTIEATTLADIGPGACPAYRGMAYIVFANMDLTQWGGSIPSLNVQVTRAATPAYPFTEFDSLSPQVVPFDPDGIIDWTTQYYYGLSAQKGLSVWDLAGSTELQQIALADMDLPSSALSGNNGVSMFTIVPGRYIVLGVNGSTNTVPFYVLDINSLKYLRTFGTFSNSLGQIPSNSGGLQAPSAMMGIPMDVAGVAAGLLAYCDLFGHFSILDLDSMKCVWTSLNAGPDDATYVESSGVLGVQNKPTFVIGSLDTGQGLIYVIPSGTVGNASGFNIYSILIYEADIAGGPSSVSFQVVDTILYADIGLTDTTSSATLNLVETDMVDGGLLISYAKGGTVLFKWLEGVGIVWVKNSFGGVESSSIGPAGRSLISNSRWGYYELDFPYGALKMIDTTTGNEVWTSPTADWEANADIQILGGVIGYNGYHRSLYVARGTGIAEVFLDRSNGTGDTLEYIVSDVCTRCGLDPAQVDATELTTPVAGYVIGRASEGKSTIDQLAKLYQFYGVESSGILTFRYLSQTSTLTIPQDDLGAVKTENTKDVAQDNYWNHTKKQQFDLPQEVHIKFFDPSMALQTSDQYERRIGAPIATMNTRLTETISVPVVMTASEAKQAAQNILYTTWITRDTYASTLGWKYLALEPGDVTEVAMDDGSIYAARSTKTTTGADFTITTEWEAYDAQTYASTAIGASGSIASPATAPSYTYTSMVALDLPYLKDTDVAGSATAIVYYGCGLYTAGSWTGALILKAFGDSAAFTQLGTSTSLLNWGTVPKALPSTDSPFSMDNTTLLSVYPYKGANGSLSSTTMDLLLSGANSMVIGSEIIQFLKATKNIDGSYTLQGLLRGRRGTEWACNFHVTGERFVILDRGILKEDDYASSARGSTETYKAIGIGASINASGGSQVALTGAALQPYAPSQISCAKASNGTDLGVSWVRRTRYGGSMADGTGVVPLNEESEAYEAYVLAEPYSPTSFDALNPSTYVRSFTGLATAGLTYTADEMTADGFTLGTSILNIVVFQMSAVVGRGFAGFVSVPTSP